jgi:hypothetical protein
VPGKAVRRDGNAAVAFILRDGVVERRAVAVGGMVGDEVEVLSGVRPGDRLVVNPPAELGDGSRVRARAEEN